MSGSLSNFGSWWASGDGAAPASPLSDYADRMRAALARYQAAPSPLVDAYTPPAYQAAGPHVDVNAVIAAMNGTPPPVVQDTGSAVPVIGTGSNGLEEGGSGAFDGYEGQVNSLGELGKAVLGGAGAVFGGPVGGAALLGNSINGYHNGTGLFGLGKSAAQALGLMGGASDQTGGLSSGGVNVSQDLGLGLGLNANMLDNALNGLGDITPGGLSDQNSLSGGPDKGGAEREFNAGAGGNNAEKNAEGKQGFKSGGYTGDAPVTKDVGDVHGKEYVLDAPATKAVGVKALNRINKADPEAVMIAKKVADRVGKKNDRSGR